MNILFISYWSINEGLTSATVFPHIEILSSFPNIKKIFLVTIERKKDYLFNNLPQDEKVNHIPLISQRKMPKIISKMYDFIEFPDILRKICINQEIDIIIARGTPAGALALKVSKKTKIPFFVESFEPHSAYMHESGTWKWFDPRYVFQKKWENQQIWEAKGLMPVAENYRKYLIANGVDPGKIDVMPCCVPLQEFAFNPESRNKIRNKLKCENKFVGVYTGKFGGIYMREEAFDIFKAAFDFFGERFFLFILSPDDPDWIKTILAKNEINTENVFFSSVPHKEVSAFLSAADFAFSLQSPKPSNLYLSPIKNAEYWAAGLPILITRGVGDDHEIILKEKAGAFIFGHNNRELLFKALGEIEKLVYEEGVRNRLYLISKKYRNFALVEKVYRKVFSKI